MSLTSEFSYQLFFGNFDIPVDKLRLGSVMHCISRELDAFIADFFNRSRKLFSSKLLR